MHINFLNNQNFLLIASCFILSKIKWVENININVTTKSDCVYACSLVWYICKQKAFLLVLLPIFHLASLEFHYFLPVSARIFCRHLFFLFLFFTFESLIFWLKTKEYFFPSQKALPNNSFIYWVDGRKTCCCLVIMLTCRCHSIMHTWQMSEWVVWSVHYCILCKKTPCAHNKWEKCLPAHN